MRLTPPELFYHTKSLPELHFQDIAVFSAVTRKAEDLANGTLVVETISSNVVYYCEATVADMNGDSHVLRSNTLIVKKICK